MFRVTRNAITERDEEEADDLLEMIEIELRKRKFAPVVRLQVDRDDARRCCAAGSPPSSASTRASTCSRPRACSASATSWRSRTLDIPELRDAPHAPAQPVDFLTDGNIFHAIRDAKHLLVHHPYESFQQSVERFLREAADDPKVRAIKMTLYRTSKRQRRHQAPRARRAATASRSRSCSSSRRGSTRKRTSSGRRAWSAPASTSRTASSASRRTRRSRSSCATTSTACAATRTSRPATTTPAPRACTPTSALFTCDDAIGRDLTELFNYLTTGYKPRRKYAEAARRAEAAQAGAAREDRARDRAAVGAGERGHIQWKLNALEDVDIVRALYRASQRGVTIDLIVRDTCRLRPGLDGVSSDDQGRQRRSAASSSTSASTTSTTAGAPSTTSARRTRCSATSRSASRCCADRGSAAAEPSCGFILDTQLVRSARRVGHAARRQLRPAHRPRREAQPAAADRAHRAPPERGDAPAPPQGAGRVAQAALVVARSRARATVRAQTRRRASPHRRRRGRRTSRRPRRRPAG